MANAGKDTNGSQVKLAVPGYLILDGSFLVSSYVCFWDTLDGS
jgi:cyclophilin family peptidyl-prolyl cis-trans isomerase